jgi:hypothetical protein
LHFVALNSFIRHTSLLQPGARERQHGVGEWFGSWFHLGRY